MLTKTTIQIVKHEKETIHKQETTKILCLDDPADDDLHKIYFIESKSIKRNYYKIIATAFGATSCSCMDQTKNPYQSCNYMKILDEIVEQSPNKIQKVKYML